MFSFLRRAVKRKNLDRYGNEHGGGYRIDEHKFCPRCGPPPADPRTDCLLCGGYGEVDVSLKYLPASECQHEDSEKNQGSGLMECFTCGHRWKSAAA